MVQSINCITCSHDNKVIGELHVIMSLEDHGHAQLSDYPVKSCDPVMKPCDPTVKSCDHDVKPSIQS